MATRSEWVARARDAIVDLLTEHHAISQTELEARLTHTHWGETSVEIQPHILTLGRRDLHNAGVIRRIQSPTRGGSEIQLWRLDPIPGRKKRATEDAAARKRLLMARWQGWSRASAATPNLIGKGGETVVHNSLLKAAAFGYRLIQPRTGEVTTLFGESVPGGSLDNAAWLTTLSRQTQAPTGDMFLVPFEVKNIRSWLYPNHAEIYQLLYKAARLATSHPHHPVLPILICRRAHTKRTLAMAADLGLPGIPELRPVRPTQRTRRPRPLSRGPRRTRHDRSHAHCRPKPSACHLAVANTTGPSAGLRPEMGKRRCHPGRHLQHDASTRDPLGRPSRPNARDP